MNKEYKQIQLEESRTWCIEDPVKRAEKLQRETVRYPMMARQMGLSFIDTAPMVVWDVGGGPVGLSSVIPHQERLVIDPLTADYRQYFDTSHHLGAYAEEIKWAEPDLVIITNALDHFSNPRFAIKQMVDQLKAGAYFSQFHAINNALTHPHEAHAHNINPEWLHDLIDGDFETCWELTYSKDGLRYGWVNYQGKVGQPAMAGLYRKVTGYG